MSVQSNMQSLYLQGEAHFRLLELKQIAGADFITLFLPADGQWHPFWSEKPEQGFIPAAESAAKVVSTVEKNFPGQVVHSLSFEVSGKPAAAVFFYENTPTETQEKAFKNGRAKVGQALEVAFSYLNLMVRSGDKPAAEAKPAVIPVPTETDDITRYASLIQKAIMRSPAVLQQTFSEVGLYYRPCEPVRGDFYWFQNHNDHLYIAAGDCTGSGIAGVFMSVLAKDVLSSILEETPLQHPADILTEMHSRMIRILTDNHPEKQLEDGLDISLCRINKISLVIEYSGANLPLIFWNGKDLLEYRSARQAIANNFITDRVQDEPFTNTEVYGKSGDAIFLMTDGISDQFGDDWSKKLTKKKLLDFIREHRNADLNTLPTRLELFLTDFRGTTPQTDDYLLIGMRL